MDWILKFDKDYEEINNIKNLLKINIKYKNYIQLAYETNLR